MHELLAEIGGQYVTVSTAEAAEDPLRNSADDPKLGPRGYPGGRTGCNRTFLRFSGSLNPSPSGCGRPCQTSRKGI